MVRKKELRAQIEALKKENIELEAEREELRHENNINSDENYEIWKKNKLFECYESGLKILEPNLNSDNLRWWTNFKEKRIYDKEPSPKYMEFILTIMVELKHPNPDLNKIYIACQQFYSTYRFDLEREADIFEDVCKHVGYPRDETIKLVNRLRVKYFEIKPKDFGEEQAPKEVQVQDEKGLVSPIEVANDNTQDVITTKQ